MIPGYCKPHILLYALIDFSHNFQPKRFILANWVKTYSINKEKLTYKLLFLLFFCEVKMHFKYLLFLLFCCYLSMWLVCVSPVGFTFNTETKRIQIIEVKFAEQSAW